jgi:flagellar assembly protein FliH
MPGADRLTTPAAAQLAELEADAHRTGYESGLTEGREQGRARGMAAYERDVTGALEALAAAATALREREDAVQRELDGELVGFALDIVRHILGRELELAENPGQEAMSRALRSAPDVGEIRVRLAHDDARAIAGTELDPRVVAVVPDPGLSSGDCILEVGAASVDARLAPALTRLQEVLRS